VTYAVNEVIEMAGALAQGEFDQQFQQDFPVTTKQSRKAATRIETRNAKQIQMIKPYKSSSKRARCGFLVSNSPVFGVFWSGLFGISIFGFRIYPFVVCFVPRRRNSASNFVF
jgi:hypothetical protein